MEFQDNGPKIVAKLVQKKQDDKVDLVSKLGNLRDADYYYKIFGERKHEQEERRAQKMKIVEQLEQDGEEVEEEIVIVEEIEVEEGELAEGEEYEYEIVEEIVVEEVEEGDSETQQKSEENEKQNEEEAKKELRMFLMISRLFF